MKVSEVFQFEQSLLSKHSEQGLAYQRVVALLM